MSKCSGCSVTFADIVCDRLRGTRFKVRETYGAKFTGTHPVLARCVLNELRSDSRWLIRGLQYDVRIGIWRPPKSMPTHATLYRARTRVTPPRTRMRS